MSLDQETGPVLTHALALCPVRGLAHVRETVPDPARPPIRVRARDHKHARARPIDVATVLKAGIDETLALARVPVPVRALVRVRLPAHVVRHHTLALVLAHAPVHLTLMNLVAQTAIEKNTLASTLDVKYLYVHCS